MYVRLCGVYISDRIIIVITRGNARAVHVTVTTGRPVARLRSAGADVHRARRVQQAQDHPLVVPRVLRLPGARRHRAAGEPVRPRGLDIRGEAVHVHVLARADEPQHRVHAACHVLPVLKRAVPHAEELAPERLECQHRAGEERSGHDVHRVGLQLAEHARANLRPGCREPDVELQVRVIRSIVLLDATHILGHLVGQNSGIDPLAEIVLKLFRGQDVYSDHVIVCIDVAAKRVAHHAPGIPHHCAVHVRLLQHRLPRLERLLHAAQRQGRPH
mmetsp:Transcript_31118/g.80366  ORF Transcript_31118/g.80366 Transcript_31118/m.80366 type:complete len:273 (-) Transcript_31118:450-1268(-)